MITKFLWESLLDLDYDEIELRPMFILIALFLSCFTLPIDLILSPLEIIAIIIEKIILKGIKYESIKRNQF